MTPRNPASLAGFARETGDCRVTLRCRASVSTRRHPTGHPLSGSERAKVSTTPGIHSPSKQPCGKHVTRERLRSANGVSRLPRGRSARKPPETAVMDFGCWWEPETRGAVDAVIVSVPVACVKHCPDVGPSQSLYRWCTFAASQTLEACYKKSRWARKRAMSYARSRIGKWTRLGNPAHCESRQIRANRQKSARQPTVPQLLTVVNQRTRIAGVSGSGPDFFEKFHEQEGNLRNMGRRRPRPQHGMPFSRSPTETAGIFEPPPACQMTVSGRDCGIAGNFGRFAIAGLRMVASCRQLSYVRLASEDSATCPLPRHMMHAGLRAS